MWVFGKQASVASCLGLVLYRFTSLHDVYNLPSFFFLQDKRLRVVQGFGSDFCTAWIGWMGSLCLFCFVLFVFLIALALVF